MIVRVATVLSAREWEPGLVAHARDSGAVRIVVRAYQPEDIDRHAEEIDVVVAGGEIAWVTPACVAQWRDRGMAVVGIVPAGDLPAEHLLTAGGANEVVPDTIDVAALVQAIRFVAPAAEPATGGRSMGGLTCVVGARGAPGVTEVAVAYALATSRRRSCILADLDIDAPSVAIRLGLAARPDLTDAADAIRSEGRITSGAIQALGSLDVLVGSHRSSDVSLSTAMIEGVIRACRSAYDEVIADLGSSANAETFLAGSTAAILVVDGTPTGIVRAAELSRTWIGPAPALILNKVRAGDRAELVEAARRWTGLEPALVLADRPAVRRASASGGRPERRFARVVGSLQETA